VPQFQSLREIQVFASGATRDRLVAALVDEAKRRPPNIPPLPPSFQHFRSKLGAQVYGAMGIAREDAATHAAAVLRNWQFFRAPLAGAICMHRDLNPADALSVGMFLQTFLLALTERELLGLADERYRPALNADVWQAARFPG
jgi:hypothetical protein